LIISTTKRNELSLVFLFKMNIFFNIKNIFVMCTTWILQLCFICYEFDFLIAVNFLFFPVMRKMIILLRRYTMKQ